MAAIVQACEPAVMDAARFSASAASVLAGCLLLGSACRSDQIMVPRDTVSPRLEFVFPTGT
ncbi:MAG TPA: hypothetical protein VNL98_03765, partial [Gemmatimonadales bacterium]|nr:hypothetical protein [Gemmatimonadales bacterium]